MAIEFWGWLLLVFFLTILAQVLLCVFCQYRAGYLQIPGTEGKGNPTGSNAGCRGAAPPPNGISSGNHEEGGGGKGAGSPPRNVSEMDLHNARDDAELQLTTYTPSSAVLNTNTASRGRAYTAPYHHQQPNDETEFNATDFGGGGGGGSAAPTAAAHHHYNIGYNGNLGGPSQSPVSSSLQARRASLAPSTSITLPALSSAASGSGGGMSPGGGNLSFTGGHYSPSNSSLSPSALGRRRSVTIDLSDQPQYLGGPVQQQQSRPSFASSPPPPHSQGTVFSFDDAHTAPGSPAPGGSRRSSLSNAAGATIASSGSPGSSSLGGSQALPPPQLGPRGGELHLIPQSRGTPPPPGAHRTMTDDEVMDAL